MKGSKINEINIGDQVRSYDFPGLEDCYIEGEVVGFETVENCPCYRIAVHHVVWDGQAQPNPTSGDFVFPPVNGTSTSMGKKTNFVEKI